MSEPLTKHTGHLVEGLGWTSKTPTEEGSYWYRWNLRDTQPITVSYTQLEVESGCLPDHGEWHPIPLPTDAPAQDWYKASEVEALIAKMTEALQDTVIGFERCMRAAKCGEEFIQIKLSVSKALLDQLRKGRG